MPVVDREKERAIVERARQRGWSDEKIRNAVLTFREQAAPQVEAPKPEGTQGLLGVLKGAGKGVASTFTGISGLGEKMLGSATKALLPKSLEAKFGVQEKMGLRDQSGLTSAEKLIPEAARTPKGTAEKIGFAGEQIAEAFLPAGAALKATKAATGAITASKALGPVSKLIARGGARATIGTAEAGGTRALQTGGDMDQVKDAALLGGALPLAGAALAVPGRAVAKGVKAGGEIAKKAIGGLSGGKTGFAAKQINSILRTPKKEFRFGRDPGATVADELAKAGVTPNSDDELLSFITRASTSKRKAVDSILNSPEISSKRIDLKPAIDAIDKHISKWASQGEEELVTKLTNIKRQLTNAADPKTGKVLQASRPRYVSPSEATKLKRDISDVMQFTGQAFEKNINQARNSVRAAIDKLVDEAAPGIKELNDEWAGLISAQKSLEDAINVGSRRQNVNMGDLLSGVLGTAALGPVGIGGIGLLRFLNSTSFKTRAAVFLRKQGLENRFEDLLVASKKEQDEILKDFPVLDRRKIQKILDEARTAFRAFVTQTGVERDSSPPQTTGNASGIPSKPQLLRLGK